MHPTQENMLVRVIDTTEITFSKSNFISNFPLAQLLYCESGSGFAMATGETERPFCSGDMLYLAEAQHFFFRTESKVRMKKIACDISFAPHLMDYYQESHLQILQKASPETTALYSEIYNRGKNSAASESREVSLKLYRLMLMMGQEIAEKAGEENMVLQKMARCYQNYMFRKYKVGDAVKVPAEVDMLFTKLFAMDARRLNTVMRLDMSKSYIVSNQAPEEIAFYCGFHDAQEFFDLFKSHFKMTVHEYRELF